jgi:hypothetical protein
MRREEKFECLLITILNVELLKLRRIFHAWIKESVVGEREREKHRERAIEEAFKVDFI